MRLGIDFGTSFSSAAFVRDGHPVAVKPGRGQSPSVPSIVAVSADGALQVGQVVARLPADRTVREFKQYLGDDEWPLEVAARSLHPVQLISRVLAFLRDEAPATDGAPEAVVLTVPASYGPHRRELMCRAGEAAGFREVEILEEPIAAAHYYAREGALDAADGDVVVVYDLGGGTFDTALLELAGDSYQTIGYAGLPDCGGIDFDTCLFEDIKRRCERTGRLLTADGDDRLTRNTALETRLAVREFCDECKRTLSDLDDYEGIVIRGMLPPEAYHITRPEFETMIAPLIDETIELTDGLVRDADLAWQHIRAILMVGGSCRIPYIRTRLQQLNPHVLQVDDLDLAVAYGAAIHAHHLDDDGAPSPVVSETTAEPGPRAGDGPVPTAAQDAVTSDTSRDVTESQRDAEALVRKARMARQQRAKNAKATAEATALQRKRIETATIGKPLSRKTLAEKLEAGERYTMMTTCVPPGSVFANGLLVLTDRRLMWTRETLTGAPTFHSLPLDEITSVKADDVSPTTTATVHARGLSYAFGVLTPGEVHSIRRAAAVT